jgi:hypothetical protein
VNFRAAARVEFRVGVFAAFIPGKIFVAACVQCVGLYSDAVFRGPKRQQFARMVGETYIFRYLKIVDVDSVWSDGQGIGGAGRAAAAQGDSGRHQTQPQRVASTDHAELPATTAVADATAITAGAPVGVCIGIERDIISPFFKLEPLWSDQTSVRA